MTIALVLAFVKRFWPAIVGLIIIATAWSFYLSWSSRGKEIVKLKTEIASMEATWSATLQLEQANRAKCCDALDKQSGNIQVETAKAAQAMQRERDARARALARLERLQGLLDSARDEKVRLERDMLELSAGDACCLALRHVAGAP